MPHAGNGLTSAATRLSAPAVDRAFDYGTPCVRSQYLSGNESVSFVTTTFINMGLTLP